MVRPSGELRQGRPSLRSQLAATLAAASSESPAAPAVVANASLSIITSASGGKSSTVSTFNFSQGCRILNQISVANAKAAAAAAAAA